MRASRPTAARMVEAILFGWAFAMVCRGGACPSRKPCDAAGPRADMESAPTGVAARRGCGFPGGCGLSGGRRGGIYPSRGRSRWRKVRGTISGLRAGPAARLASETRLRAQCKHRPLQGSGEAGLRFPGWPPCLPGPVGRAFTPAAHWQFQKMTPCAAAGCGGMRASRPTAARAVEAIRSRPPHIAQTPPSVAAMTALIVCMRLPASANTSDCGPSNTSSVTSMASRPNFSPISLPTAVLWSW